ncbi:MAG: hypothetical protein B6U97_00755 [Candidatus Altiarchaeales archaeon ex4484_96]|nr:MAG: hypothetical protein B6U97_00755 [Candidatus Altiarchaeales archaeon ex4484_96]
MKELIEYIEGKGPLYNLNPLTKLFLVLIFWVIAFYSGFHILTLMTLFLFILAFCSGMGDRFMKQASIFSLYVIPFIFALHVFFPESYGTQYPPLFPFEFNPSFEKIYSAANASLRLYVLFCSSLVFVSTTNPLTLLRVISSKRFFGLCIPYGVVFFLLFVNRSIYLILYDLEQILDAQKARGFSLKEASWRNKISGYASLLVPLLTLALERAQRQAVALDLKGFRVRSERGNIKT